MTLVIDLGTVLLVEGKALLSQIASNGPIWNRVRAMNRARWEHTIAGYNPLHTDQRGWTELSTNGERLWVEVEM